MHMACDHASAAVNKHLGGCLRVLAYKCHVAESSLVATAPVYIAC